MLETKLVLLLSTICHKPEIIPVINLTTEQLSALGDSGTKAGKIWGAIQHLYSQDKPISIEGITYRLNETNDLASVGKEILTTVAKTTPVADDVAVTISQGIADDANIELTKLRIITLLDRSYGSSEELVSKVVTNLLDIPTNKGWSKVEEIQSVPYDRVCYPVGILKELSQKLGGVYASEYMIIAGQPSMGKTAIACQIAKEVAISGVPVGFLTMEQRSEHLVSGRFKDITDSPIYVIDRLHSQSEIFHQLQIGIARYELKVVILDYIQLCTEGKEDENKSLTYVSRRLRDIANRHNIAIVVLSQVSREARRMGDDLQLHDLRGCGSLEQDADQVILIQGVPSDDVKILELAKYREGALGRIKVKLNVEKMEFDCVGVSRKHRSSHNSDTLWDDTHQ